jgi:membrane-associated protein
VTAATDPPHGSGPALPWGSSPARADVLILVLISLSGLYALALLPVIPALVGSHPLLLEWISGSTLAEVTVGALSRLGELPLWVPVTAGVPASMMFDWVYWWAGRRWGDRAVHLLLGQGRSRRSVAKREARVARLERLAGRFGPAGVVLAYYLPLPTVLIYAAAGLSGMRLRTFLLLDLIGTLLWVGLIVGLGYALGQRAVDVVGRINHYSLYLSLAVFVLVVGVQVYRRRAPN